MVDALHPQRRAKNIGAFCPRHSALPRCTEDARPNRKCNPAFSDQPRPCYATIARNLAISDHIGLLVSVRPSYKRIGLTRGS
jgi:hypothetical protein